jgi:hypothetical protein
VQVDVEAFDLDFLVDAKADEDIDQLEDRWSSRFA